MFNFQPRFMDAARFWRRVAGGGGGEEWPYGVVARWKNRRKENRRGNSGIFAPPSL